jgi:hypothetical protein
MKDDAAQRASSFAQEQIERAAPEFDKRFEDKKRASSPRATTSPRAC